MRETARDGRALIITDDPGWHGRSLRTALAARGVPASFLSLRDAWFSIGRGRAEVRLPGFDGALPRGVFVRGVAGGSLEEVILRLNVLHALAMLDVPVMNSGRAIERTVDKTLTSFLLARHSIPTPETWACEAPAQAQALCAPLFARGRQLVLKPMFGSQGEGLLLLKNAEDLAACAPSGGVFYLQEFLGPQSPPYRDWRVMVIAGIARFCMVRESAHWITNRAQGGRCVAAFLDPALVALAEGAARALEVDYAGVDLLLDERGHWVVTEVNGVPAWWGLSQATAQDVTGALADAFCARLG